MSEAKNTVVDPITAAIAQASANAEALIRAQMAQTVTLASAPSAAPAIALRPGAPLSMGDMDVGGLSVDSWIGVNKFGLTAGASKSLVTSTVTVEIDLSGIAFNMAIKFGQSPPVYYKSYDRVLEARGGSWDAAIERAQKADPKARPYNSADVPMTLLEDVMAKKEVLAAAGTTAGYSISTTGWSNFKKFWSDCAKAGLAGSVVKVELEAEPQSRNNNTWGVIKWKLLA